MAPFDGKYTTSYLVAMVMFTPSLTVCEIFVKQEKCQNFDIENEGRGQGIENLDLRHPTRNFRLHIADFFFRIAVT